jgi:hypothetical protein
MTTKKLNGVETLSRIKGEVPFDPLIFNPNS